MVTLVDQTTISTTKHKELISGLSIVLAHAKLIQFELERMAEANFRPIGGFIAEARCNKYSRFKEEFDKVFNSETSIVKHFINIKCLLKWLYKKNQLTKGQFDILVFTIEDRLENYPRISHRSGYRFQPYRWEHRIEFLLQLQLELQD